MTSVLILTEQRSQGKREGREIFLHFLFLELQVTGWIVGVSFPEGEKDLSLLCKVQTVSRVHPASYQMSTRGYLLGGKAAGP